MTCNGMEKKRLNEDDVEDTAAKRCRSAGEVETEIDFEELVM